MTVLSLWWEYLCPKRWHLYIESGPWKWHDTSNLVTLEPSHSAWDKYPTIHHFVTEMCTHVHISVTNCCMLWDMVQMHSGICEMGLVYEDKLVIIKSQNELKKIKSYVAFITLGARASTGTVMTKLRWEIHTRWDFEVLTQWDLSMHVLPWQIITHADTITGNDMVIMWFNFNWFSYSGPFWKKKKKSCIGLGSSLALRAKLIMRKSLNYNDIWLQHSCNTMKKILIEQYIQSFLPCVKNIQSLKWNIFLCGKVFYFQTFLSVEQAIIMIPTTRSPRTSGVRSLTYGTSSSHQWGSDFMQDCHSNGGRGWERVDMRHVLLW